MPIQRLKNFLDTNRVKYVAIAHSLAYTAQEIAALTHIKGREMAKTVMVRIDGEMAMAVVPASFQVDLDLLARAAGSRRVELADEADFKGLFPHCEVGAMPPFGNLYKMEVYCAPELAEDEWIAFNAGTHTELVRMAWDDFANLVKPKIVHLCAMAQAA